MPINPASQPSHVQNLINQTNFSPVFPVTGPYSWTGNSQQAATVTYSFDIATLHWEGRGTNSTITNVATFTTTQQSAAVSALSKWSNVANVTFTSSGSPNLTFVQADIIGNDPGLMAPSDSSGSDPNNLDGGDIYLDKDYGDYNEGGDGFDTLLHEIGHSLGLRHTTGIYDADLSIMSYDDGSIVDNIANAITPMIYDIAAAQFLYGANYSYNNGNTSYTLDGASKAETIWDGGGTDTITAAGQTAAATIDLRGGVDGGGDPRWSHVGDHYMAIAFDPAEWSSGSIISGKDGVVDIENATGGTGNDTLIGNDLNNVLNGGDGIDRLDGGGGNDTLVLSHATGTVGGPGTAAETIEGGSGLDVFRFDDNRDFFDAQGAHTVATATDADNSFTAEFNLIEQNAMLFSGGIGSQQLVYRIT